MDLLNLINDVTGNLGVIAAILGLVEYSRRIGLKGNALLGASMATGLLLGGGALISIHGTPVDFGGYFYTVVGGIMFGLIASGIVDLTGRITTEAVANVAVATGDLTKAKADAIADVNK